MSLRKAIRSKMQRLHLRLNCPRHLASASILSVAPKHAHYGRIRAEAYLSYT